ncbi:hypothetical protein AcW1_007050 [Taiwanofungus camphoratus]|nr:hypothetical protein AcV5_002862 [Antrodia cinnamomea]KAI0925131.1 hypothetical protein AcW2_005813 [Antrodia cinnamomea]KAI0929658.1 hypothetical protein AcV7_005137 [Antrodia cinnamomea]KAI0955474.1 hypothetical protein AcW1_007050 [Antrodia cinnamomea]
MGRVWRPLPFADCLALTSNECYFQETDTVYLFNSLEAAMHTIFLVALTEMYHVFPSVRFCLWFTSLGCFLRMVHDVYKKVQFSGLEFMESEHKACLTMVASPNIGQTV